jgi:hypothetical protein
MLAVVAYPWRRTYYQQMSENVLLNHKNITKFNDIKTHINASGGYFSGFASYGLGAIPHVLFNSSLILSVIFAGSLGYPLRVNAMLKALDQPGYKSLKDTKGIASLYTTTNAFRGIFLEMGMLLTNILPFVNYIGSYLENVRVAYILGPLHGKNFNSYREAYQHVVENGTFQRGRAIYNIPMHVYNLIVVLGALTYSKAKGHEVSSGKASE